MRHVFIVNPKAGKKAEALTYMPKIQAYFSAHPAEYRIHVTACPGDATAVAREEAAAGQPVRLYACGGDGTLMETLNGIIGHPDIELAVIPCGSGNDYIRPFGGAALFRDLEAVIGGAPRLVDGIRCDRDNHSEPLYSLNIASMGMDACVAYKMTRYKNKPLVSGAMAYNLGILDTFVRRLGYPLQVTMETAEGIVRQEGRYLFLLAANGQYYGSGYRGAPQAVPDDGLLDFVLIDAISRPKILQFLGKYKAGEHLPYDFVHVWRGTRLTVQAAKPLFANMDGECFTETGLSFEIVPGICRFVVPEPDESGAPTKNLFP